MKHVMANPVLVAVSFFTCHSISYHNYYNLAFSKNDFLETRKHLYVIMNFTGLRSENWVVR